MPGFADRLTEDDRWALIDLVRANNAGVALGEARSWPRATPAPRFEGSCRDGSKVNHAELDGRVAWIVVADGDEAAAPEIGPGSPGSAFVMIILGAVDVAEATGADTCVNSDPAVRLAYAMIAGVQPDTLGSTQFLVDPEGWLRALWLPGDPPGWTSRQALQAEVAHVRRDKPKAAEAGHHGTHH